MFTILSSFATLWSHLFCNFGPIRVWDDSSLQDWQSLMDSRSLFRWRKLNKTKIKVATYFSRLSGLVMLIRLGWWSQKDCITNPQGTLVISWMGCRHSPAEFDLGSTCSFGLSHMKLYQRIIYSCIYMEMFSTFSDFSLPWDSEVWVLELVNGDDSII